MRVTFQDAYDEIVVPGGQAASGEYERWRNDRRYRDDVVPFVVDFAHEHLFSITRQDFDAVKTRIEGDPNEHALFGVSKNDDGAATKDLNPSFAFVQLFHRHLEDLGRPPSWLEWRAWLLGSGRRYLADPILKKLDFKKLGREEKAAIRRGLRWRLGNAYYSCMREVDVLVRLRDDHGLAVRYHVLVDALFMVDYWYGSKTMSLFINNREMKSYGEGGRKRRASEYLSDPPFKNYEAVMEKQHTYGKLHLASDETVEAIAKAFR